MGSRIEVTVTPASTGATGLLDHAEARMRQLERLWSRFAPDSEVTQLNAAGGQPVRVAPETSDIIDLAVEAWRLTGGVFDPTVHDAVVAAGYDRTFEQMPEAPVTRRTRPTPGCHGIEVTPQTVRLPAGVLLDLGGIGKGRAADLVAAELIARGAAGACVNAGGDVRLIGTPPGRASVWRIDIDDAYDSTRTATSLALASGGVATSSVRKRAWRTDTESSGTEPSGTELRHHLIDPRTGHPSTSTVQAATVVASEAMWAEIYAKTAVVTGAAAGIALLGEHDLAGLLTLQHPADHPADHRAAPRGIRVSTTNFERYEPWTPISGGTWLAPAG